MHSVDNSDYFGQMWLFILYLAYCFRMKAMANTSFKLSPHFKLAFAPLNLAIPHQDLEQKNVIIIKIGSNFNCWSEGTK